LPTDGGPTIGAETVWVKVQTCHFEGDRAAVRLATQAHALEQLLLLLNQRSQ
jgi:nicotinamide mononucleotide (NMN) deamidase PncC